MRAQLPFRETAPGAWGRWMLVLRNRDGTVTVSTTQLPILPSKKNQLRPSHREWMGCQAGAHTEKPIPATSDTYQMPVMQEATPHSGQKAGGPKRPHSAALAPPTPPSPSLPEGNSQCRGTGVAEDKAHHLGTPRCHPWLERPWGGRLPLGGARDSNVTAPRAPPPATPICQDMSRAQSQRGTRKEGTPTAAWRDFHIITTLALKRGAGLVLCLPARL